MRRGSIIHSKAKSNPTKLPSVGGMGYFGSPNKTLSYSRIGGESSVNGVRSMRRRDSEGSMGSNCTRISWNASLVSQDGSQTSRTSIFFRNELEDGGFFTYFILLKKRLFEVLTNLAEVNVPYLNVYITTSWFLFYLQTLVFDIVLSIFQNSAPLSNVYVAVFPQMTMTHFIILDAILVCVAMLPLVLGIGLMIRKDDSILECVLFLYVRILRSIFLAPFLYYLLSGFRIDFTTATLLSVEGTRFWDFWCVVLNSLSIFGFVTFSIICVIDLYFLHDSLKDINFFTSGTSGRFNTLLFINYVLLAFLDNLGFQYNFIPNSIAVVSYTCLSLLLLRRIPFYRIPYVYTIATYLACMLASRICGVVLSVVDVMGVGTGLVSLTAFPVTVIAMLVLLTLRYAIVYYKFKRHGVRENFWCRYPDDVAVLFRIFPPKSIDVMNLLKSDRFGSSRALCVMLITQFLLKDIRMSVTLMKNERTMMEKSGPDVQFTLYYLSNMIREIQMARKKKYFRHHRNIRSLEDALARLYGHFFDMILKNDANKISLMKVPTCLQDMVDLEERVENQYKLLLKTSKNPAIFRNYANYLIKFKNRRADADQFLKQAEYFELIKRQTKMRERAMVSENVVQQRDSHSHSSSAAENLSDGSSVMSNTGSCSSGAMSCDGSSKSGEYHSPRFEPEREHELEPEPEPESQPEQGGRTDDRIYLPPPPKPISEQYNNIVSVNPHKKTSLSDPGGSRPASEIMNGGNNQIGTRGGGGLSVDFTNRTKDPNAKRKLRFFRRKIRRSFPLSQRLFDAVQLVFVFISSALFLAAIVTSIVLYLSHSAQMTKIIDLSDARTEAVGVAHYWRKMQISQYPFPTTYFKHERNTSVFRGIVESSCSKLGVHIRDLYDKSTQYELLVWKREYEVITDIHQDVDQGMKVLLKYENSTREKANSTLIDVALRYVFDCESLLGLPDEKFGIRQIGQRMEDDPRFIFVTLNEPVVYNGLTDLLEAANSKATTDTNAMVALFAVFPILFCISLSFFYSITWGLWEFELYRNARFVSLLPKQYLHRLKKIFKKRESLDQHGGRMSTTRRKLLSVYFVILVGTAIVLCFSILGFVLSARYKVQSKEFDLSTRLQVQTRRIHLWAVEMIYRDDTLFRDEEIVAGMYEDIARQTKTYEQLRVGDGSLLGGSWGGSDRKKSFKRIFYENDAVNSNVNMSEICSEEMVEMLSNREYTTDCGGDSSTFDSPEETRRYMETLKCHYHSRRILSLSRLLLEFISDANKLVHLSDTHNYNGSALRSSFEYHEIVLFDDITVPCQGIVNSGTISEKLKLLKSSILEYDLVVEIINIVTIGVCSVCALAWLVWSCFSLRSIQRRLRKVTWKQKELFLLLPSQILLRKSIFDYLCNRVRDSSETKYLFKIKQKETREQTLGLLKKSGYMVVIFDSNLDMYFFNEEFNHIFCLNNMASSMVRILTKESLDIVKKFISTNHKAVERFEGELECVTPNAESSFLVCADISRHENSFMAIMRDIQNLKLEEAAKLMELETAELRTKEYEDLLGQILPKSIAESIKLKEKYIVNSHKNVTCFFGDMVGFTALSQELGDPKVLIALLNGLFSLLDDYCVIFGMEKIKTIGDCYFAVCGCPNYNPHHAVVCMQFSLACLCSVLDFNERNLTDIHFRIGLASGAVVAGVIGKRKWAFDIWGSTVNLASRMESTGMIDKIQMTKQTYALVHDKYPKEQFFEHQVSVKGLEGLQTTYVYTPLFDFEKEPGLAKMKEIVTLAENEAREEEEAEQKARENSAYPNFVVQETTVDTPPQNKGGKVESSGSSETGGRRRRRRRSKKKKRRRRSRREESGEKMRKGSRVIKVLRSTHKRRSPIHHRSRAEIISRSSEDLRSFKTHERYLHPGGGYSSPSSRRESSSIGAKLSRKEFKNEYFMGKRRSSASPVTTSVRPFGTPESKKSNGRFRSYCSDEEFVVTPKKDRRNSHGINTEHVKAKKAKKGGKRKKMVSRLSKQGSIRWLKKARVCPVNDDGEEVIDLNSSHSQEYKFPDCGGGRKKKLSKLQ